MTKRLRQCVTAAVLAACLVCPSVAGSRSEETRAVVVQAVFGRECESLVLRNIDAARSEILMAAYSITRRSIVAALVEAAGRGVAVKVKCDAGQLEYEGMKNAVRNLRAGKIKVTAIRVSGDYAAMHHKFLVIDRQRVLTGSYNFTAPASEVNYENVVLIESPAIVRAFAAEFESARKR